MNIGVLPSLRLLARLVIGLVLRECRETGCEMGPLAVGPAGALKGDAREGVTPGQDAKRH